METFYHKTILSYLESTLKAKQIFASLFTQKVEPEEEDKNPGIQKGFYSSMGFTHYTGMSEARIKHVFAYFLKVASIEETFQDAEEFKKLCITYRAITSLFTQKNSKVVIYDANDFSPLPRGYNGMLDIPELKDMVERALEKENSPKIITPDEKTVQEPKKIIVPGK